MKLQEKVLIHKANTTSREFFTDKGVKCVHYGDIYKNYSGKTVKSSTIINSFGKEVAHEKLLTCDSIIVPDVTETVSDWGHFTYIEYDGTPYINGTHALALTCNSKITLQYLFRYLSSNHNRLRLQTLLNGSTVFQISVKNFNQFELLDYHETENTQQHIVDILGSIDAKIENNDECIKKIEEYLTLKYNALLSNASKMESLADYISLSTGKLDANAADENGKYPFFTCGITPEKINTYAFDCEAIIIAGNGNFNVKYYNGKFNAYQRTYVITANKYFHIILQHYKSKILEWTTSARGSVIKFLTKSMLMDENFKVSADENENAEYEKMAKTTQAQIKFLQDENAKLNELKQLYLKKFFG